MTDDVDVRGAVARHVLRHVPVLLRDSLCSDAEFRETYSVRGDYLLTFADSGVVVQRGVLTRAVRRVLSGATEKRIRDSRGRRWRARFAERPRDLPNLVLTRGAEQQNVPLAFLALAPARELRLRVLEVVRARLNLSDGGGTRWRRVLAERALTEDELGEFLDDLEDTPTERMMTIQQDVRAGRAGVRTFVPTSRRYFDRLVGAFDGSASLTEYAAGRGREHLAALTEWQACDGFLHGLYLSGHSRLTDGITVDRLGGDELPAMLEFVARYGDRMSQVGAVEVGFRVLGSRPEIAPLLMLLVEAIRDDDARGASSGVMLFSSMFHLVDAELSRGRLFVEEPPYYRRLAALAQAAMICGQLSGWRVDGEVVSRWAFAHSLRQCEAQSYVDMRREPRWDYRLGAPSQLKAEFVGRIVSSARRFEKAVGEHDSLSRVVIGLPGCLGDGPNDQTRMFLKGPLEGGAASAEGLSKEILHSVEAQLRAKDVGLRSFVQLMNAAQFRELSPRVLALATKALRRLHHRSAGVETSDELFSLGRGVATVAAVGGSPELADEVRVLVRRCRLGGDLSISMEQAVEILLIAAASRRDPGDWGLWIGEALTELAFGRLESEEGIVLRGYIASLCHLRPELWERCGRAEAALGTYGRRV